MTKYLGASERSTLAAVRALAARRGYTLRSIHKSPNVHEKKWLLISMLSGKPHRFPFRPMSLEEVRAELASLEVRS